MVCRYVCHRLNGEIEKPGTESNDITYYEIEAKELTAHSVRDWERQVLENKKQKAEQKVNADPKEGE